MITKDWENARKNFTGDLENFLRWPECLKRFVVVNNPAIKIEFESLDLDYWAPIIKESATGNPTPCSYYPESSENMIHYAYHIDTFQKKYNKKITDFESIFEFGGGYGGMARLIRKMGFKGRYIIYDLPEMNELQAYYLKEEGIDDVQTVNMLSSNYAPSGQDLLIATWSLSECPLEMRDHYIKGRKNHLMAFQPAFEGIDNLKYFNDLSLDVFPINHLQDQYYCMGVEKF